MGTYKLFLDDLREPEFIYPKTSNSDWVIVRDADEFKEVIKIKGVPSFISFDNDLGSFENGEVKPEGKDAVKWLVYEMEADISEMEFKVHSSNTAGPREYMIQLLNNWKTELKNRKSHE